MKGIFIVFILTVFSIFIVGQDANASCPGIKVIPPQFVMNTGEIMTFSVKLDETNNLELKYLWTVSEGKIVEGQNTSNIKVTTTSELRGLTIIAKVKIKGLPESCIDEASGKAYIVEMADPVAIDIYEKLSWRDEKARLRNLAFELLDKPDIQAYILLSIKKNENTKQTKKHIIKMASYLETLKISKGRLIFAIESNEFQSTTFCGILKGADLPYCNECKILKTEDIK